MSIVSNLYPPIVPDTMPAFIRTGTCKIYFSLSSYTAATDIKNVQVSVINQKSNASALKPNLYPSGIKITNMIYDSSIKDNYNYYIQINPSDLIGNIFELNQFYKVQLRFTSTEATNPPSNGVGLATWLYNNRDYFSQWSKICLIKGITQPQVSIENLNPTTQTILQTQLENIVGRMYYTGTTGEKECLRSYNIKIYKSAVSASNLVVDSKQIYTNDFNPNEINYEINYELLNKTNYILVLTYTTINLYTASINFSFKINQADYSLDAIVDFTPDPDNGRIKIGINFNKSTIKTEKNLIIKRASSKTNFYQWETLKMIPNAAASLSQVGYDWYDTTIESGVWYKYKIQQEGNFGKFIQSSRPIICVFEDMFLTNGSRQLKIQFNPTLSDFKYNVNESQQVTLGAKFPYVKRNGNNFYRSFFIGGLITAFIDSSEWYDPNYYDGEFHRSNISAEPFTSKKQLYGDYVQLYNQYNETNNIDDYHDYIYEKEFRQKVCDFLYQHNLKLFRSMTQGNILVKLMNITLSPINELGRRLYSFSATAIEVDDISIISYNKYNIINKLYHVQSKDTFTATFNSFESIFDKIYNRLVPVMEKNSVKLLTIEIAPNIPNAIIHIKKTYQNQPIRVVASNNNPIYLQNIYDKYIDDCYFYGQHISTQIIETDNWYMDFPSSPVNNTVYKIFIDDNNYVNKYVDYNKYTRTLTVTEDGVVLELNKNYSLMVERDYNKYIYYNNKWYLFDDIYKDISLSTVTATITYYYEIVKEA